MSYQYHYPQSTNWLKNLHNHEIKKQFKNTDDNTQLFWWTYLLKLVRAVKVIDTRYETRGFWPGFFCCRTQKTHKNLQRVAHIRCGRVSKFNTRYCRITERRLSRFKWMHEYVNDLFSFASSFYNYMVGTYIDKTATYSNFTTA